MRVPVAAKYVGGLSLAVGLLWWVLRGVDPALVLETVGQASLGGLVLCVVLNVGHNVFRVWRWRALLAPVRANLPFRPMFVAVILGYMTTWVVPGRLGEVVRPMVLAGREGLPLGPTLGSVVADRLLDAASVVTLFALGIWLTPLEGQAAEWASVIRGGAIVLASLVVVALGLAMLLSARGAALKERLGERRGVVAWVGRTAAALAAGFQALRQPRLAARIVGYSLLAWLTIAAGTWAGIRAVGADVSFGETLVILPVLVLGVAVPTPGGAGSYHGAMKIGLMVFGVAELLAVSAGLLVHVLITVPIILLGMLLLWTEGVSWGDLTAGARKLREIGDRTPAATIERVAEGVS